MGDLKCKNEQDEKVRRERIRKEREAIKAKVEIWKKKDKK